MDKSIVNAIISQTTKEELEKKLPYIRKQVRVEIDRYIKTDAYKKTVNKAVVDSINAYMDEDAINDILDTTSLSRLINKTVNSIIRKC